MQRQHQEKVHFQKSTNPDLGFQIFQPSTNSASNKLKSHQFSRNMGLESEKSSRVSHHVQQQHHQQQQQQDSALGTERLTSLHAKLHQEADKIRKWKVQTEMDMKHKDKKLNEAHTTIDSLRKSILELQLENENLSTKLQDELGNREEVLQRVQNTRDLVGVLKDQEERLQEKLSSCETERTELKYLEKEHAQQFEEMIAKFKKLQTEAKHDIDDLMNQVQQEQQQKEGMEKHLQIKMAESHHQIKILENKIDEKDIALRDVHVMLQKNEEKLHAADKDLGASQQSVHSLTTELSSTQQQLDKFRQECSALQKAKEELCTELGEERERAEAAKRQEDSVQEALNNSVAIFNQQQDDLHRDIVLLKTELADEQKRLKEARAQLTESLTFNESLKSSRDVLLLEKTEMELCLDKLKVELTELQSEKYKNKAEISSLESEVESLQSHLQQEQQTASRLQVQVDEINPRYANLEKEKKQLQQELHTLKQTITSHKSELEKSLQAHSEGSKHSQHLQDTITQLTAQLSHTQGKMEGLQEEVRQCQSELRDKETDISTTTAQLDRTMTDFKDLLEEHKSAKKDISQLTDQVKVYKQEKDALESRLANLETENEYLQQQHQQTGQEVEHERQTSTEKQCHLEQQLKTVSADVKTKTKAVKDLEKELKSVRGKLATQEKKQEERSREADYLKQELSACEQAREQTDKLIASLQSHLEQETHKATQSEQQVEKLKSEVAQAEKDKAEALVQCERQLIEMTATLEKYTSDHQKLLTIKDKEIDDLRADTAKFSIAGQQHEQIVREFKQESQLLQHQLATLKTDMEQLEKEKAAHIESLQSQLTQQTRLVEELQRSQTAVQPVTHILHHMDTDKQETRSVPTTPVAQVRGQTMDTQQRSILRQAGSVSKRRKVAFISPSIDTSEPSNTDSESSIELEIESQDHLMQPKPGPRTPLRLRHSPHKSRAVVSTPIVMTPSRHSNVSKPDSAASKTKLKQNTRVAHNTSPEPTQIKEREFSKTPNMRKAPMRTSKFFRTPPKERKLIRKQEEEKERMSWFDDDRIYGFGFDE